MTVTVVHFNPTRRRQGILGRFMPRRPLDNFGDLVGPVLVRQIEAELGLAQPTEARRLVAVGSILRLTQPGDVVWGSGINGKSMHTGAAPRLDIRAVRGPRTREMLLATGANVPEIYGDPALLWPRYWPREHYLEMSNGRPDRPYSVVPNHNEWRSAVGGEYINPIGEPHHVISLIARSEFICGSSLHGIVLAEAFGIPARLIRSTVEPSFKYDDYYAGTGRSSYTAAASVEEALEMGGEEPPVFSPDALLGAFPRDIYGD